MTQFTISIPPSFQQRPHFALKGSQDKYEVVSFDTKPTASSDLIVSMKKMHEIFCNAEIVNSEQFDLSSRFEVWRKERVANTFRTFEDFKNAEAGYSYYTTYVDRFDRTKRYEFRPDNRAEVTYPAALYKRLLGANTSSIYFVQNKWEGSAHTMNIAYLQDPTYEPIRPSLKEILVLDGSLEKIILSAFLLGESRGLSTMYFGTVCRNDTPIYFKADHTDFTPVQSQHLAFKFQMSKLFDPIFVIKNQELIKHFEKVGYARFIDAIHEFAAIPQQELDLIADGFIAHTLKYEGYVATRKAWVRDRFNQLREISDDLKANPRNPFIS